MKIFEEKQVGKLYRSVDIRSLQTIISADIMNSYDNLGYISFSRNKFYRLRRPYISNVTFVVDGDKLSNNYKIYPYMNKDEDKLHFNEFETRVNRPINSFSKYVLKVIVPDIKKLSMSEQKLLSLLLQKTKFHCYENLIQTLNDVYGQEKILIA